MNQKTKTILYTCISLLVIVVASTVSWHIEQRSKPTAVATNQEITVRLKWLHQAQFAGMYLAQNERFYIDAGLKVNLQERDLSAGEIINEVAQGRVMFGIVNPLDLLDAVAKGVPVQAVAVIYQESPSILAARTDTPLDSPHDLAHKTVGLTNNSVAGRILVETMLKKYNVPNTITYTEVGSEQLERLLQKKSDVVSFYRTESLYRAREKQVQLHLLKPENWGIHLYDDVLIASIATIQTKPDVVQKFVSATVRGWEKALANPNKALMATSPYTKGAYTNPSLEQFILEQSAPLIKPAASSKIGDMDYNRWKEQYTLYREYVVTAEFDVSTVYTLRFLQ